MLSAAVQPRLGVSVGVSLLFCCFFTCCRQRYALVYAQKVLDLGEDCSNGYPGHQNLETLSPPAPNP